MRLNPLPFLEHGRWTSPPGLSRDQSPCEGRLGYTSIDSLILPMTYPGALTVLAESLCHCLASLFSRWLSQQTWLVLRILARSLLGWMRHYQQSGLWASRPCRCQCRCRSASRFITSQIWSTWVLAVELAASSASLPHPPDLPHYPRHLHTCRGHGVERLTIELSPLPWLSLDQLRHPCLLSNVQQGMMPSTKVMLSILGPAIVNSWSPLSCFHFCCNDWLQILAQSFPGLQTFPPGVVRSTIVALGATIHYR